MNTNESDTDPQSRVTQVLDRFYRVPRAGQQGMTDGGGPFGFDITTALLADDLLAAFQCDAIVETGCYLGDTATYLAAMYPGLPIHTCDVWQPHTNFTTHRLRSYTNVTVSCQDSPDAVAAACAQYDLPLFFLDAHGGVGQWPLRRELEEIAKSRAIVMIHDFKVGHPRFSYDTYDGVDCGPELLATVPGLPETYFTPDPLARWPLPCQQVGRRSGVAVLAVGVQHQALHEHPRLVAHRTTPRAQAVMAA